MNLNEAKKILSENGYTVINESHVQGHCAQCGTELWSDEAYLTYIPLVKLVLIYKIRRINKEYQTREFNDILTSLILELKNLN